MSTKLFKRHLSRQKGGDNMKLTFHLIKTASKSGGDRYEAGIEGEDRPFVVYFPQSISRFLDAVPRKTIEIEIKED